MILRITVAILALISSIPRAVNATHFRQCLKDIRNETWRISQGILEGGRDHHGGLAPLSNTTTAISYDLCKRACGPGPESPNWPLFSQQFGSWVLPWLALLSQLPFGANDNFENLVSVLLTVGSPTLAAFSLALTVLNGRWAARLFASYDYHNTRNAALILSSLQQSPLKITTDASLLASLVVLPENDEWWRELVAWLDFTHTWSISAATSIVWVLVAYIFTLIDSFSGQIPGSLSNSGQGIGSIWLWLLPIVVGWLQTSPKCDSERVLNAIDRANRIAYVATPDGPPELAGSRSRRYAISLKSEHRDLLHCDEDCTVPIYNYARFPSWVQAVETVADAFRAASERVDQHISVDPQVEWVISSKYSSLSHRPNRAGTRAQVEEYCVLEGGSVATHTTVWGSNVWSRMFIASVLALLLQWGTAGAAILIAWSTPTIGFGCRSGSYILYAVVSTLVWILLVSSSFLSHYATKMPQSISAEAARLVSLSCHWIGKALGICNAIWITIACTFQFTAFLNRCYCTSGVLAWGEKAFHVFVLSQGDADVVAAARVGGLILSTGSVAAFALFIAIFVNPRLPPRIVD